MGDPEALRRTVLEADRLEREGDRDGAIAALRSAVALAPSLAPAHARLGVLLQEAGRVPEAIAHFAAATRITPDEARAWSNLAAALNQAGRFPEGEEAARRAVAADPRHALARFNLARALLPQGRGPEALAALREATSLDPANGAAWDELGSALLDGGRVVAASGALERATTLDPSRASSWSRLGAAYLHLGRNREAFAALARAESLARRDAPPYGSNLLVALHYDDSHDARAIFEAHRAWAGRHAPRASDAPFANDRSADRALRVGYVSPRFHGTSLASLLEPVLTSHDPQRVQTWCYASQAIEDEVTQRIRRRVARYVDASPLDDEALARRMRADAIDVAVDLSGHTPGHRLLAFARRPAPVCITWLDYFDTTGLATMDQLVSDAGHSPPGDAQLFTEDVIRLERIRFCYVPPAYAPEVLAPPLARGAPAPVLASFNRVRKISPRTLRAWAQALDAVPGARLVVKGAVLGHDEERAAYAERFRAHGIDPGRVEWRGHSGHAQMLAEYNGIDVALDTFPYNGGITTLEALWMGRPVVTVRGDSIVSRQSAALLAAIGFEDLVADDECDFGRKVASLVADAPRLATLSAGLRSRMRASPLGDPRGLARALEEAYGRAWRDWVARGAA